MATSLQWPLSSVPKVACATSFQRLYKNCRQGIKQLVISFGSIFLLFSNKVAGVTFIIARGNRQPLTLNDSPVNYVWTSLLSVYIKIIMKEAISLWVFNSCMSHNIYFEVVFFAVTDSFNPAPLLPL